MLNINCGSLCVRYILERIDHQVELDPDMLWTSELALFIKNNSSLDLKVRCYNSNLLNDYYKTNNYNFEGFYHLNKMLDSGIILEEEQLTTEKLIEELDQYTFIILCVESAKINNDSNMNGGHYIVLEKTNKNLVKINNPQKNKMKELYLDYSDIIDLCYDFGSWRILVKE